MRPYLLSSLLVLLSACSFDAKGVTESTQGSQSGTDGPSTSGSATDVAPTTTGTSSGSVGETDGPLCTPGASGPCECPEGGNGTQECASDGMSFGACDCSAVTATDSTATTDPMTTMTDPSTTTTTTMGTDPMTTMTEETTVEGTTSGTTTTGDESSSSTGDPPPMCKDDGPEPNEDEATAVSHDQQDCSDGEDMFKGTLNGADDVDFHKYFGSYSNICGGGNPAVVTRLTTTAPVRFCVYAKCPNNNASFSCDGDETSVMSPGQNIPGCCIAGVQDYEMNFVVNCPGVPETFDVFIKVEDAPANACLDYTIKYSYDA